MTMLEGRTRTPALLLAAALTIGGLLLPSAAHAGSGDLVRGFGKAGHRDLGRLDGAVVERAQRGRVVVAGVRRDGAVTVSLFSARGDVVQRFGRGGTRVLGRGASYSRVNLEWSANQDRIIVNAHRTVRGSLYARLWALTPEGNLDRTFGNRGTVSHGPSVWTDIVAQRRKLLVLGQSSVARLRGDGETFDPTFNNGAGSTTFTEPGLVLRDLDWTSPDFFVTGTSPQGIEVYRLSDSGVLRTTWGDAGNSTWAAQPPPGFTVTGYSGGLTSVRDREEALVLTGVIEARHPDRTRPSRFPVVGALLPNGYLDETFRNGRVRAFHPRGEPVAISRGRTLVPGTVDDGRRRASVTRLTRKGRLDRDFGTDGSYRDRARNAPEMTSVLEPWRGVAVALLSGRHDELVGIRP